ncbi:MAG: hypothetical protein RLZZ543_2315, partial [Bacteroidota bacterium]
YLMEKSTEEYKLEPELLWVKPSEILSIIKKFRYPILYKRIYDIRPFTEVYFPLLKDENFRVRNMNWAIDNIL